METDSLSVASTQADEDDQVAVEESLEALCVTEPTSEGPTDDNGYSRHFKKNATNTSSSASRSPAHSRNVVGRGGRMRQFQSRGGMFSPGRFAQTPPTYMGRMYGMATPMGVQMPVVPPFPGEYFEPQGSLFSPRFRVPPTTPLRHFNSRGGGPDSPGGGGGVRRRAKSPTSVPSSADATSPQQSRDVGRERRVRECKENRDEGTPAPKSQAEEPATPPAKNESGRRENQKFSAATPTNDPRSSAPLRSLRTESGRVTYPLIYVSPAGSISVILSHAVIIEMSIDRCVRVVCHDNFAAFINGRGTASCILHKKARMLHTRDMVYTKFSSTNDRLAVIGDEGILFSMSHLNEAYLVSSHIKGPSAVSLETLDFSSGHLENDFSIRLFYHEAQTGTQFTVMSKEIVHEASYDRKSDGSLLMHINGMSVRQSRNGEVTVDARPRVIQCSPSTGAVFVRSSYIDMGVQESEKAYVKRGLKRVHVSRSGMVVSDGNCITSMDHFGRIVSST
ncbi:hypothetical protein Y032_0610g627 [Ancylostoma ceylanicum]|uniref:Uncharacterized protein n=2 Tax=Ancylostoma TaxID=29169 RepID=A0A016WL14_9BILA|nr:hypothetical protein Y032_0610g627 [Ancylostoma ceylanicum]